MHHPIILRVVVFEMLSFMTVELIKNTEQNEKDVNQQAVGRAGMGKHGFSKTAKAS